jgi:hypothetical protein
MAEDETVGAGAGLVVFAHRGVRGDSVERMPE